ncbi:PLP-dependent aminotransferase family protein [Geosporobacter ferrireducens]|uniref:Transcriptional regulator n=1 Tax=Geosporobacter ferrireducens TaxID=1424294 RepID=A0A1D8GP67_9FIRM|nr:PLP-dependent aminotransferase family protein [Geosporobacter ferrireducens]AOT72685.1 transcriptional regulator [Geosporobacter ferrireducens]MTI55094.1 PLP-dependent aminotransferase family protein [Geosporobacter ferrireducens]
MKYYEQIQLSKQNEQHLYVQLFEAIKNFILEGLIVADEKLPPIRQLAEVLGVNNATVVKAYELLEKEGYIYKRIGSGTFVSPDIRSKMGSTAPDKFPLDEDLSLMNRGQIQIQEHMISFASATPTPDLFPVDDFQDLLNEILNRDKGNAFGYQESQGYYPLRESLVAYMKQYEINTKPENIQIISGAQQGIDVIAKAFVNPGDVVIVEKPTYTGAIATFKSRGAKIIDIEIYKDGMDIEKLETVIQKHKPKLIYMMPNFQNPTGYSYSDGKKHKILELAYQYDLQIVEDDYLSDLSFYNTENITLKSIDQHDQVIYIKSFSKIFMPGLRLGFLVLPEKTYHRILAAKHASDISTSGLIQRAFDLYLRKGIWKRHIHFMEHIYKERFEIMDLAIRKHILPYGVTYNPPLGGLSFWLCLNENFSTNQLYNIAAKKNILMVPGAVFFVGQKDSNCFRLSTAAVYPEQIEPGMIALSEAIREYIEKKESRKNSTSVYTPLL